LENQEDDDFSFNKIQALLGICNDLHRKFDKAVQHEQVTDVNKIIEQTTIRELTNIEEPLTRQKIRDYFSLFGGKKAEPLDAVGNEFNNANRFVELG
jgi:hypothetical protein